MKMEMNVNVVIWGEVVNNPNTYPQLPKLNYNKVLFLEPFFHLSVFIVILLSLITKGVYYEKIIPVIINIDFYFF